ncbi:MAG: carbon storage regulator [Planctomycetes bacterium]|nr:carbon storage regulator [Planctomycetota bacterium]
MLVLSRKVGEKLVIGGGIEITVRRIQGNRVALAISAPDKVTILRAELLRQTDKDSDPGHAARPTALPGSVLGSANAQPPDNRLPRYAALPGLQRHPPASAS